MDNKKREMGFHAMSGADPHSSMSEVEVLDKSFTQVLGELVSDEDIHKKLARLDKRIHDELAKVYNHFLKLEKDFLKYNTDLNQTSALHNINPNECLHRIPELITRRNRLYAGLQNIYAELNSHNLSSYNSLYNELKLDNSHRESIAYLTDIIISTFNSMSLLIKYQVENKTLEELADKIQSNIS